jgi:subtilase family serine protease
LLQEGREPAMTSRAPLYTLLFLSSSTQFCLAQTSTVQPRITQAIDEQQRVRLAGNTHPLAQARFDFGPAPDSLAAERMLLLLQRGPDQEAALRKLLEEQQTKSSPNYHRWLSPQEFGQQFGPAETDIASVTTWLQSHGFRVNKVSAGRTVIEFSGTAGQVRKAFHTEIHKFVVNDEEHWANASDPQIPAALQPVVRGFVSLHNFRKQPQIKSYDQRIAAKLSPESAPQVTFSNGHHALGPGDYAVIYNMNPILQGPPGVSGPPAGFGTTIAIVGRSNINIDDVSRFWGIFAVRSDRPEVFLDGPDPGNLGGGEEVEAVLDTSWSGALAPGAMIRLVVSASTEVTDGADLSELYIIDNDVGQIMSESFGGCEALATSAQATAVNQLAEQAAAEGITYIVSSGDTGSAGCDHLSETTATGPLSVNLLASTPFTVAVGGTQFNENGSDSLYWSSVNNGAMASALRYIPEDVWNESCTVTQCGQSKPNIAAGGGGASMYFSNHAGSRASPVFQTMACAMCRMWPSPPA